MNIDLLISKNNDVGIVSTGKFESQITAVIFDHGTREISLEFGQTMDSLPLNIPVAEELVDYLDGRSFLYFIGTDKTHIHEAYKIPLMHLNNQDKTVGEWA